MDYEILNSARHLADTNPIMAYIFFFLNSTLQILFPPYPGDSIIVLGGYLSSVGILNTPLLVISTLTSTYLSSTLLYFLSYKFSDKVTESRFTSRYFNIKRIYSFEKWFSRYGSIVIIINKFFPGVGSLTLISAGIFKLPPIPALLSIAVASIIHDTFLLTIGRITGDNIDIIKRLLGNYNRIFLILILISIILFLFVKFIYKSKHKKILHKR